MSNNGAMRTLSGLATARGFASGPVFVFRGCGAMQVPEFLVEPGSEAEELNRLRRARAETRRDIENLIAVMRERAGDDGVRVFESHLLILEDELLVNEAEGYIVKERMNAAAAVRRTSNSYRAKFARMNDPYFRERVRDLDDVERRLLQFIGGFCASPQVELKTPSIVIADDLTPSEAVQLPREMVLGFAMNGGSTTSHVTLLARALGIPAVCGLADITSQVKLGDIVLLDGTNGTITLNPDFATLQIYADLIERQHELSEEVLMGRPAGTLRDGSEVRLFANVHPGIPIDSVKAHGARGIGLYRSEYLWLNGEREPSEEEQFEAYRSAAVHAANLCDTASIVIRTLDIGGDKLMRGVSAVEQNPFLGNRSIRYLLTNRDCFRTQLRAILRASAFGRVRIMYPMVSCIEELQEAEKVLSEAKDSLSAANCAFDRDIQVGAMIEVPSAALNADALAKYVRFFSIGTNDLVQYTMAADRGNKAVAHLYQPTNPAILKLIRMVVSAAERNHIDVVVCGESAADPIVGVLWVAMGVNELSMSSAYIPVISKLLSRLTRADLDDYRDTVNALDDGLTSNQVFERCRQWMQSKIPDLDNIVI